MTRGLLGWLYRKLGPRYPRWVLIAQLQLAHVVVLGGVGLLLLYQPMSEQDFLRILLVSQVIVLLDNVAAARLILREIGPAEAWLAGRRDETTTLAAWRTLVDLPITGLRRRVVSAIVLVLAPIAAYATVELDLPASSAIILFGGGAVTLLYGIVLRLFAIELATRPILRDVSGMLPDGVSLGHSRFPLRVKLLVGLPLINIITGVVVSGLSTTGTASLEDLGLDVVVAIGVAFTISLELTILLSKSVLEPVDDLRSAAQSVGVGDLSARVPVVSNDEVGDLSRAFNSAVAGLGERERLREAFGSYVDPDVADRVLAEGLNLAGEEAEVTVLFVDVRDFTGFAEASSAREVVARLNDFFGRVVPVITRHGGHANKFLGDGVLAVFGAPDRLPDHADRAVLAGLELVEVAQRAWGSDFRVAVGINSGRVVAGTVGGGGRVEFTAIGDAVNTAARVEAATRQTGDDLLITEATRRLLRRVDCAWEARPAVPLKGKTERVGLWAPAGARPARAPRRRAEISSAGP